MTAEEKQRLIERARAILLEQVPHWEPASREEGKPLSGYEQLGVAVRGALAGDPGVIPTLHRVLDERFFATTNSLNENALASLGLALLGDHASIPRIRAAPGINLNREAKPLALAILDALEEPSSGRL
ncbi:hypothetical protein [Myxococcus qinghaiensis]|uniref:hypothetical protein n=1 Tax=Myxococcus qinghaiensis TaxID=2906758 RepID=UPI0020A70C49|nr:hypothetical protein [Myxococcus qinghaiensis]MCP3165289.1 hypothetical protein [Myxococcus qinghaiensis]